MKEDCIDGNCGHHQAPDSQRPAPTQSPPMVPSRQSTCEHQGLDVPGYEHICRYCNANLSERPAPTTPPRCERCKYLARPCADVGMVCYVEGAPAPHRGEPEVAAAWVVWSKDHSAWWGPKRGGYTPNLPDAGVYTEAEAKEIESRSCPRAGSTLPIGATSDQAAPLWAELVSHSRNANVAHSILDGLASLAESRAELARVREDYENREAAICPEDVGFEEYIATLNRQLDAALSALGPTEEKLEAAHDRIALFRTELLAYGTGHGDHCPADGDEDGCNCSAKFIRRWLASFDGETPNQEKP